jgi:hypothetical protein
MGYSLCRCIFVSIKRAKEMKEDRCCCDRRSALRLWPQPASLAGTTAWMYDDALSSQSLDKRTHVALCPSMPPPSERKEKLGFLWPGSEQRLYSQGRVPPSRRMPRILLGLRATTRLAWGLRWHGVDVSALAIDFIHYSRTYQGQQRIILSRPSFAASPDLTRRLRMGGILDLPLIQFMGTVLELLLYGWPLSCA